MSNRSKWVLWTRPPLNWWIPDDLCPMEMKKTLCVLSEQPLKGPPYVCMGGPVHPEELNRLCFTSDWYQFQEGLELFDESVRQKYISVLDVKVSQEDHLQSFFEYAPTVRRWKRAIKFACHEIWQNQIHHQKSHKPLSVSLKRYKNAFLISFSCDGNIPDYVILDRLWIPWLHQKSIEQIFSQKETAGIGLLMISRQFHLFCLEQKDDRLNLHLGFTERETSWFQMMVLPEFNFKISILHTGENLYLKN